MGTDNDEYDPYTTVIDKNEAVRVSQLMLAMVTRLLAIEKAGGLSQDDMLFLVEKWLQVSLHYERGEEARSIGGPGVIDARKQVLPLAYSKQGLLRDFKADPEAPMAEPQYFEDAKAKPLKPSLALRKTLGNLMNHVYNIHELQRRWAFMLAENAFLVLYYNYRTRLAGDRNTEARFRQAVGRLRHAHSIR